MNQHTEVTRKNISSMFDSISHNYDFLNHLLSGGLDYYWRWYAKKKLGSLKNTTILDIAAGTGDLTISLAKSDAKYVYGLDISKNMLKVGEVKARKEGVSKNTSFLYGEAENLPFEENTFDSVTIAFGIRNFEDPQKALFEINRVLKKNGKLVILELTRPAKHPVKFFYCLHTRIILPLFGKIFAQNKDAYTYLPSSIKRFPSGKEFVQLMENAGLKNTTFKPLSCGITMVYYAEKGTNTHN